MLVARTGIETSRRGISLLRILSLIITASCAAPVELGEWNEDKAYDQCWYDQPEPTENACSSSTRGTLDCPASLRRHLKEVVEPALVPNMERSTIPGTTARPKCTWSNIAVELDYAVFRPARASGDVVVIVHGLGESWQTHALLIHHFFVQGYTVAAYSQRGFGHSTRLAEGSPPLINVFDFFNYPRDLELFLERVVDPLRADLSRGGAAPSKVFAIGHSMGGAVVASFALNNPTYFQGIALSSPMFDLTALPVSDAAGNGRVTDFVGETCIARVQAAPELPRNWDTNDLTHSCGMYAYKNAIWSEHESFSVFTPSGLTVGPKTYSWVAEARKGATWIQENASRLCTPTLVLTGGNDVVVQSHRTVCRAAENCEQRTFPDGRHELLMESAAFRPGVLQAIDEFFRAPVEDSSVSCVGVEYPPSSWFGA